MYDGDSPWDTDVDQESDTFTPAYKRGKHPDRDHNKQGSSQPGPFFISPSSHRRMHKEPSDAEAVACILKEGVNVSPVRDRQRKRCSVLVLADSQLKYWPDKDSVCRVVCHPQWPIKRWSQAVHLGLITINCHSVVLYLEGTRNWQDIPPIKNVLTLLCKTIRNHGDNPRIFISNHLPKPTATSPLQYLILHSNFTLQQAIRSTSRALKGGVFEMSIYEHFTSCKGKVIKPWDLIFVDTDNLTVFGCMVFRECLMREMGVKSYWFE